MRDFADDLCAITECHLCDDNGIRTTGIAKTCDHIDHAAAAQRGMNLIRHTLGWNQP